MENMNQREEKSEYNGIFYNAEGTYDSFINKGLVLKLQNT